MECQPINDSEGTMAPRTAIRTDLHEPGDLRRLARGEAVPRAARRMLAIANAMDGMVLTQAARVVGIERQSLGDAIRRYNAEGLAGLYDRPKPRRASSLPFRRTSSAPRSQPAPTRTSTASRPTRWKISPGSRRAASVSAIIPPP